MATHLASTSANTQLGVDNKNIPSEHAGASYAHAVLNFKSVENNSNKENINEETAEPHLISRNKKSSEENIKEEPSLDDGAGVFTPVVSHSRKERKNEKNKKNREAQLNRIISGNSDKREAPREPTTRENSRELINREQTASEKEENSEKKVFVEAPLPTNNPWQKQNAVPTTSKETEKRVLQPQKQDQIVNGQATRGPKEKRRNNQKVFI